MRRRKILGSKAFAPGSRRGLRRRSVVCVKSCGRDQIHTMTDDEKRLLRHFLAALAYRTQKALHDAPAGFGEFAPGHQVRSPTELVRHMTSVLGYARTFFIGGQYRPEPLPTFYDEIARLHETLESLASQIDLSPLPAGTITAEKLLQGPLA